MSFSAWETMATASNDEDSPWELFHENSKAAEHEAFLSDEAAEVYARQMPESLVFEGYAEVKLPAAPLFLQTPLSEAVANRPAVAELAPRPIPLEHAAALLRHAYGTAGGDASVTARRRRTVHSEGSLFPLEIFIYSARVTGLAPGIYHFEPPADRLRFLRSGDQSQKLASCLLDGRVALNAALLIFIAAMPERSVVRYGDRGYRFALLEAGAVVQNLNLAAGALDLTCRNLGEFYDRRIDEVLNLDGLTISTLYAASIGKPAEPEAAHAGRETK
jgi:SagB-type dehydrogenase family enzyme